MKNGNQGDGGGRPEIELSQEQIEMVGKLAPYLTTAQMADVIGISRATFFRILEKNEEVLRLYKKGQSQLIANAANSLAKLASEGNVTASIFILKTRGGWTEHPDPEVGIGKDNVIRFVRATGDN